MKRKAQTIFAVLALCLFAIVAVGCKDKTDGVTVRGKLTRAGAPVEQAVLTFIPGSGRPVGAAVANGEYSLKMPAGEYKVTVDVPPSFPPGYKEGDPVPPPKFVLGEQYTNSAKTTLTATVSPSRSEPINFDLK